MDRLRYYYDNYVNNIKMEKKDIQIPRNKKNQDKIIKKEGYVTVTRKGWSDSARYYKREYTDGCVELVRYSEEIKKWIFLLFPNGALPLDDKEHPLIIEDE